MAEFNGDPTANEGEYPEGLDPEALADFAGAEAVNEDLVRERDEMRALAQRVQADFENYRKRMLREQTAIAERASESIVEQLLPVLDNLELALLSLDDADEKLRKGVELVYADFLAVLERAGLERIPTNGEAFDPEIHEAVAHEARTDEGGAGHPTVVETMREGYLLKGRVLRPAMVKVAG